MICRIFWYQWYENNWWFLDTNRKLQNAELGGGALWHTILCYFHYSGTVDENILRNMENNTMYSNNKSGEFCACITFVFNVLIHNVHN